MHASRTTHLGQRKLLAAAKKGARVGEQGLDLLDDGGYDILGEGLGLFDRVSIQTLGVEAVDLGEPGVYEEGNSCASERSASIRR